MIKYLLLNLPQSFQPESSPRTQFISSSVNYAWRDRSCLAHCVCINVHSKEKYMTFQTFLEVFFFFFLKLLKTFTGSWYKLCPLKLSCCVDSLERWDVAYKEINYRSWRYNSILCPVEFWHSYTCLLSNILFLGQSCPVGLAVGGISVFMKMTQQLVGGKWHAHSDLSS